MKDQSFLFGGKTNEVRTWRTEKKLQSSAGSESLCTLYQDKGFLAEAHAQEKLCMFSQPAGSE